MADLVVDATLDQTNSDLKTILSEFQNCEQEVQASQGAWGNSSVASAMDSFANNWYVHRASIQSALSTLSSNVNQCCQAWTSQEKQLTDSVQVSGSPGSSSQSAPPPASAGYAGNHGPVLHDPPTPSVIAGNHGPVLHNPTAPDTSRTAPDPSGFGGFPGNHGPVTTPPGPDLAARAPSPDPVGPDLALRSEALTDDAE